MRIDEPRQGGFSFGFDYVDGQAARLDGSRRGDRLDPAAGDEDVAQAQGTRGEYGRSTDEKGHGKPPARDFD